MTRSRSALAAAVLLAGSAPAYAASSELGKIGGNFVIVTVVVFLLAGLAHRKPVLNEEVAAPVRVAQCALPSVRR